MGAVADTTGSAELSFSRSVFGFDPLEVRTHVAKLNQELVRLRERNNGDVSDDAVADDQDVAVAIDSTVNDIAEVLEAARVAANKIRDRAERQAVDGSASAARQVRGILAAAEADAFAVRKSAWDTSTELLESAKAEGARLRSSAERDALDIIGDAERKAHRNLAAARRDSDNAMQVTSAESERLMGMARAKAKEIIRAAEDRAATILDQVSVLEKQHEDLRHDVEALRAELEGPSGASNIREPTTVRVVPPGGTTAEATGSTGGDQPNGSRGVGSGTGPAPAGAQAHPADGTKTVRLVSAPPRKDRVNVDASEIADAVAALSGEGLAATTGLRVGSGDEAERDTNPARGPLAVDSHGPADKVPDADSRPTRNGSSDGTAADELAALFDELRMREATIPAAGTARSGKALTPLERYDFELLPIVNRAVRGVKRQLTDIQREQIRALELDPEGWIPRRPDFGPYLIHAVSVMEREACERGFVTATELSARRRLTPPSREVSLGEGRAFIDDLFDGVSASIRTAREANRSDRDISSDLSTVFRRWRTEEVERRLRLLAGRAYHRGLVDGLERAGMDELLVVAADGCDTCAQFGGGALAPDDLPEVPVHEGCRCTVIPA